MIRIIKETPLLVSNQKNRVRAIHHFLSPKRRLETIDFKAFALSAGEAFRPGRAKGERFLVLLSGRVRVFAGDSIREARLSRGGVFSARASGLFVPAGTPVRLEAETASEIAVCRSRTPRRSANLKPFIVRPRDLEPRKRGRGRYTRTVTDLLSARHPADHLLVGETRSDPGMWSSYPPHKHDRNDKDVETRLEEIYYYRVERKHRFGIQMLYSENREEGFRVHDHDTLCIAQGYHPVCAPPDSRFYYLWVLGGSQRRLLWRQDPDFA